MEEYCELCICSKKEEEIIFQTKNFYIRPSLGHIIEGYLLICSKEHLNNLSDLPIELFNELEEIKKKIREIIDKEYSKKVIFFEHGSIKDEPLGKCCIAHAHLHAVPLEEDILKELTKHFETNEVGKQREITSLQGKNKPYLYYENQEERKFLLEITFPIPSQYLRQVIASKTPTPNKWNWREYPEIERFNKTLQKLKKYGKT
jgi:diadenosine tetraphosphate (Ap4A) HIT family hydrolase